MGPITRREALFQIANKVRDCSQGVQETKFGNARLQLRECLKRAPFLRLLNWQPEILFDIYGMQESPHIGGGYDIKTSVSDLVGLKAKFAKVWRPREDLLKALSDADKPVIARVDNESNSNDLDCIEQFVPMLIRYNSAYPKVQLFNETNLTLVGKDEAISPEESAERFMLSARLTVDLGGIPLTSPVAQRAEIGGIDEFEYYRRYFEAIKGSLDWKNIRDRTEVVVNAYTFNIGENPLEYVAKISDMAKDTFGLNLPLHVGEAGLFQDMHVQFNDEEYKDDTLRILNLQIPDNLRHMQTFNIWLCANEAQSWPLDENRAKMPDWFEYCAWRREDGTTPVFEAVRAI